MIKSKSIPVLLLALGFLWMCSLEDLELTNNTEVDADNAEINKKVTQEFQSSSTLVMVANYDNFLVNSGIPDIGANLPSPSRRFIDREILRQGTAAIKHKLYITDPEDSEGGSMRSESHIMNMLSARIKPNSTTYYGFSIYFPTTWETDKFGDIVFQWKAFGTIPNMIIIQKQDGIYLRRNFLRGNTIIKEQNLLAPISKGEWHDFRFRVVWRPYGTEGRVEVDHKLKSQSTYTRVVNHQGPNMFDVQGYLKWGIYKPSWAKDVVKDYTGGVTQRVIWHDNIKIGRNWKEVDPSF